MSLYFNVTSGSCPWCNILVDINDEGFAQCTACPRRTKISSLPAMNWKDRTDEDKKRIHKTDGMSVEMDDVCFKGSFVIFFEDENFSGHLPCIEYKSCEICNEFCEVYCGQEK